jgi:hypothetical protein
MSGSSRRGHPHGILLRCIRVTGRTRAEKAERRLPTIEKTQTINLII